jgi:hypothetical protein
MSIASSKTNSPHRQIQCFLLQFPVHSLFLKVISSCLLLLHPLPVTSHPPSIFSSITCFSRLFTRQIWPIQLTFLIFINVGISFPHWHYVIPHFWQETSKSSFPSFCSITLLNVQGISDPSCEVFHFQQYTKLCSRFHNVTYLLTPWSRVLEKLTGSQLVNKFPTFYGTRRFITAFTTSCHLSLSGASSIQSIRHISLSEDLS